MFNIQYHRGISVHIHCFIQHQGRAILPLPLSTTYRKTYLSDIRTLLFNFLKNHYFALVKIESIAPYLFYLQAFTENWFVVWDPFLQVLKWR